MRAQHIRCLFGVEIDVIVTSNKFTLRKTVSYSL